MAENQANTATQTTLPTSAATGQIDLAQLTAIIANVATTVLRQVMVIGDPVTGTNIASAVPDEPQGWETGLVVNMVYARQLKEVNDTLLKVLSELQNHTVLLGGMPTTEREFG
jgi:hypothetical protein